MIDQKYHRNVMGQKGYKVQDITREHNVQIKFPDRPQQGEDTMVNGDADNAVPNVADVPPTPPATPKKCDIIVISGRKENCELAHAALQVS